MLFEILLVSMVDNFESSVNISVDSDSGIETADGSVEVILNVPIHFTSYDGSAITDEDIQSKAIEAIQEGEARVIQTRPTVRDKKK